MGAYYTHITVSEGLPPDMRHLKPKKKRRRGRDHRELDESSIVSVRGWPIRSKRLGVLSYSISSCNVCGNLLDKERWSEDCIKKLHRRLDEEGMAKGRVLFLVGEDWWGHKTVVGLLAFHVPQRGTVRVLVLEAANDIAPERRTPLFAALLLCAQYIARESDGGNTSRLEWLVTNRGRANDLCARYGFREQTVDRDGYHLARDMNHEKT